MDIDYKFNYYKLLNLPTDFTPDQLRNEYRRVSKLYHPDVSKEENAEVIFKQLVIAYKVLQNTEYRADYDKKSPHGRYYDPMQELYDFKFTNVNAETENLANNFDNFKNNEMIHIFLKMNGFKEIVEYDRLIYCDTCEGSGVDSDSTALECCYCDGTGISIIDGCKCTQCNGTGKMNIGKCYACDGKKRLLIKDKVKLNINDFKNNKLVIFSKGHFSDLEIGKVGNLYIQF